MNKFSNEGQVGSLLIDDIFYKRQLNAAKKKFEREIYGEYFVNTRAREAGAMIKDKRSFLSHPQRMNSNSDTSGSNSPRKVSTTSTISTPLQEVEYIYQNEFRDRNLTRFRKPHSNLTQTKGSNHECNLDEGIGDSQAVKPRKLLHQKNESNFTNSNLLGSGKNISQYCKNILTDSMFEKKFELFVEKSLHTISDIRSLIEKGIDPPDGDEDISRRLLRVKEFSNRFSRNYLYPINRQLEDLNKIKSSSLTNTNQKLLSAYHVILNGLQAYLSHLPTSIGGCSSDKLKLLLKQLIELLEIHQKMVKESEEGSYGHLITNFRLNTELTLEKIENHFTAMSNESMLKSNATKISLLQNKSRTAKPKKSIVERLSMYNRTSAFRKDSLWKKTADSLTKKNNVKSRYKTSLFKHRPPREPCGMQILPLPSKCKLLTKKSSSALKNTPHFSPINEDNIVTMIEIEENNNDNENQKEDVNHEELVFKLLQLVLDNNRSERKNDTKNNNEEKIADILNKLRGAVDSDMLQKIADSLRKNNHVDNGSLLKLNILNHSASTENTIKRRKEPTVTVTGTRNAKLICIKDDNSLIESDEEIDLKQKEVAPKSVTSHTQTEVSTDQKKNKSTQRPSSNLKRLVKSSRKLETLPKEYAVNIIQHKLDFHKYCKNNSMYRKTTSIVPWKLMAKLSDELVDLALLNVAKEIKVNEIAERIYRSELQL